jgi:hypothetical protein
MMNSVAGIKDCRSEASAPKLKQACPVREHRTDPNPIAYKGDDMAASEITPVLIGDTLSTSINSAHVSNMTKVSKATGLPLSGMLDRAIGFWLEVEAPVHLEHARRKA